jgi:hypothetical protein
VDDYLKMKTISDLKESNLLLEQYNGSLAEVWSFNISLKQLLIKLTKQNESETLFIIAVKCEHIAGPFSWENSRVSISKEIDQESSNTITKIIDNDVSFELVSNGGFALAQGPDSDFGKSFVNFTDENGNG